MLLLAASWKVGDAICSDWAERRRVNNLTQKHIDDLLPAVERYRVALVVSGYVGRDELGQYATGSALASLQRRWDEMQTGDRVIGLTSLDYTSSEVLMYTESMAKLVTMVRWREAIYGPDDLEFSGQRTAGGWVRYTLQFEDGVWKVSQLDACPVQDQACVKSLRNK
jgi:hypothetical protein